MEGPRGARAVYGMVFVSGLAGLTWELLWQLRADLALGVSALGAAITLACTMGGMALGSWALGRALRRFAVARPLRAFAALEVVVGLAGQALGPAFDALERVDSAVYARSPSLAPMLHALGVALVLGPPTVAMGATLPVFRLVGERHGASVARLYGINTAGASLGVLLAAFVVLPKLGLSLTASLASVLNLSVAAAAWLLAAAPEGPGSPLAEPSRPGRPEPTGPVAPASARALAFGTGLATFVLQVAWFRSLRAAFQSSTDSFALVLASMLVPLALGAHLAVALRRRRPVAAALVSAGVLALVVTPAIERFDLISLQVAGYWHAVALRFAVSLTVLGAAVLPLGVVLPLLLDQSADASESGALYSSNTVGGVFGALLAGWVLLPTLGSVRAAWLAGVVLVAAGLAVSRGRQRLQAGTLGALALAFAVAAQSGVGRTRVQKAPGLRVVRAEEGPDASVAVVQGPTGARSLFIDGFDTTGETVGSHYMAWMGRLPMLLHPAPRRALVICFGTGQTANGVRREGVERLDIVDVSPAVLSMAPLFPSNERVLQAPGVRPIVMDGRAWLRRTSLRYDVVTLEPMSPRFAGTNALYSLEFYRLVAARLTPEGVAAQWLPIHLLSPFEAASIAATFQAVFGDASLWLDPVDHTGVLLGRVGHARPA